MLILSNLQEVVVIFELLYCPLVSFMLFVDLLLAEKVYFDLNIVYDVTGVVWVPLLLRKYSLLVGNVELIDQNFHYFLRILLKVNHQFSFLFFGNQLINPLASMGQDLWPYLFLSIDWYCREAFVEKGLTGRFKQWSLQENWFNFRKLLAYFHLLRLSEFHFVEPLLEVMGDWRMR